MATYKLLLIMVEQRASSRMLNLTIQKTKRRRKRAIRNIDVEKMTFCTGRFLGRNCKSFCSTRSTTRASFLNASCVLMVITSIIRRKRRVKKDSFRQWCQVIFWAAQHPRWSASLKFPILWDLSLKAGSLSSFIEMQSKRNQRHIGIRLLTQTNALKFWLN